MEGELREVQSHYEAQLVSKDQLLTQKDQQLQQHIKASSQRCSQKQGLYNQIIVGVYSCHLVFIAPNFYTCPFVPTYIRSIMECLS